MLYPAMEHTQPELSSVQAPLTATLDTNDLLSSPSECQGSKETVLYQAAESMEYYGF